MCGVLARFSVVLGFGLIRIARRRSHRRRCGRWCRCRWRCSRRSRGGRCRSRRGAGALSAGAPPGGRSLGGSGAGCARGRGLWASGCGGRLGRRSRRCRPGGRRHFRSCRRRRRCRRLSLGRGRHVGHVGRHFGCLGPNIPTVVLHLGSQADAADRQRDERDDEHHRVDIGRGFSTSTPRGAGAPGATPPRAAGGLPGGLAGEEVGGDFVAFLDRRHACSPVKSCRRPDRRRAALLRSGPDSASRDKSPACCPFSARRPSRSKSRPGSRR